MTILILLLLASAGLVQAKSSPSPPLDLTDCAGWVTVGSLVMGNALTIEPPAVFWFVSTDSSPGPSWQPLSAKVESTHACNTAITRERTSALALSCNTTYQSSTTLGGVTISPGVYCLGNSTFGSSVEVGQGELVFDGGVDPDPWFVVRVSDDFSFTASVNSTIRFAGTARPHHVYWLIGSWTRIDMGTDGTMDLGTFINGAMTVKASRMVGQFLSYYANTTDGVTMLHSPLTALALPTTAPASSPVLYAANEGTSAMSHTVIIVLASTVGASLAAFVSVALYSRYLATERLTRHMILKS